MPLSATAHLVFPFVPDATAPAGPPAPVHDRSIAQTLARDLPEGWRIEISAGHFRDFAALVALRDGHADTEAAGTRLARDAPLVTAALTSSPAWEIFRDGWQACPTVPATAPWDASCFDIAHLSVGPIGDVQTLRVNRALFTALRQGGLADGPALALAAAPDTDLAAVLPEPLPSGAVRLHSRVAQIPAPAPTPLLDGGVLVACPLRPGVDTPPNAVRAVLDRALDLPEALTLRMPAPRFGLQTIMLVPRAGHRCPSADVLDRLGAALRAALKSLPPGTGLSPGRPVVFLETGDALQITVQARGPEGAVHIPLPAALWRTALDQGLDPETALLALAPDPADPLPATLRPDTIVVTDTAA